MCSVTRTGTVHVKIQTRYYVCMQIQKMLISQAEAVLKANRVGNATKPAPGLYPHQWFWDSCFIAIGLRWTNIEQAKAELRSLAKGQWHNGMIPHIIFSDELGYHFGPDKWQSSKWSGLQDVQTSCITQPPMLAEAVYRVGIQLSTIERKEWYQEMLPVIIAYHTWLYRERTLGDSPFISLIHPWECGLDNTPYWLKIMRQNIPLKLKILQFLHLEKLLNKTRKDTKQVPASERPEPIDLYIFYNIIRQAKQNGYNARRISNTKAPVIEDLVFNAIFIRANDLLMTIAAEIDYSIDADLVAHCKNTKAKIDQLYEQGTFWSRDVTTGKLIKEQTIANFITLYSGALSTEQAQAMMNDLHGDGIWRPAYGVTTTPTNSRWFLPKNYWRGPVWVNMNWLIIDGLRRYGYHKEAEVMRNQTIAMVANGGVCAEYYSPIDGTPAGSPQFSWTAALTIDLIKTTKLKIATNE